MNAIGMLCASAGALAAVMSAHAAELCENGSFETVAGDAKVAGWSVPKHYRVEKGAGMNGTRGLVFENTDEKGYYSPIGQFFAFKPGVRYAFSAWARTECLTKPIGVYAEWYDANGKWITGTYLGGLQGTHDWAQVKGVTPPIPSDAAKVCVGVTVQKGAFGKAWFDDVSVRPFERMVCGGLYSSAYRNCAAEGKVRFHAAVNLKDAPGARGVFVSRDAAGAERRVAATRMTADAAEWTCDVRTLALGTQTVAFELAAADGKSLGRATLDFTRLAAPIKRRVAIDEHGRTLVDGEPFFPLGIYLAGVPKKASEPLFTGPFNCVMPYTCDSEGLDFCQRQGLKVIYPINSCWAWVAKNVVLTDADADRWAERKVMEAKDHPALLAWYCNDEISLERLPQLVSRQRLIERIDPDHPTWTVLYQFSQVRDYYPSFDVIGTDPYPIAKSPIGSVAAWTRTTRDETMGLKPMWQVPQAFGWGDWDAKQTAKPECRFPTREEMVNMTWQCVANGANGLVYWCYRLLYQGGKFRVDRWADICAAAASVKPYAPIFLSGEESPVASGATEALSARAWRYQGEVYLAVVNNTDKPVTGELKVENLPIASLARLQGADGCTPTETGRIRVALPPLGVAFLRVMPCQVRP